MSPIAQVAKCDQKKKMPEELGSYIESARGTRLFGNAYYGILGRMPISFNQHGTLASCQIICIPYVPNVGIFIPPPVINVTDFSSMSFRKRNIGLTGSSSSSASSEKLSSRAPSDPARPRSTGVFPGVRSSPVDGRPTTSTGTPSLDDLLAGHAGLALGHSVLIEESGTTDYAGILLRYYAAEGVLQGHQVHVVGVTEHWARELPGPVDTNNTGFLAADASKPVDGQKMKIAWRYEQLGEFGTGTPNRRGGDCP